MEDDEVKNCWLDCDPGLDDIFAIVLAAQHERLNLLGISTVAGNLPLERTTCNALHVLNLMGMNGRMRVIKGASRPLMREPVTATHVHGSGLGLGVETSRPLPELPIEAVEQVERENGPEAEHFTTRMSRAFKSSPKPVTLIAIGPLTNVALLLLNHPDVVEHIDKIVVLGGALGSGNVTPVAEYNMYADPHAAAVVFENAHRLGVRTFMIPLETTAYAAMTDEAIGRVRALDTPLAEMLTELLVFYRAQVERIQLAPKLHDPLAVVFVAEPGQFEHRAMRVDVEVANPLTIGQTVCDARNCFKLADERKNVRVCVSASYEGFWRLMLAAIERASRSSPL